jgi:hypothetical protein
MLTFLSKNFKEWDTIRLTHEIVKGDGHSWQRSKIYSTGATEKAFPIPFRRACP